MSILECLHQAAYQYGLRHLWSNFESKLSDLFTSDASESKVGVVRADIGQVRWVSTPTELYTAMEAGGSTLLILNRYNSWSRIDVTTKGFFTICELARITPFFLHFVVGMGIKSMSKDEDFMSCYSTYVPENQYLLPQPSGAGETRSDSLWGICYSIRHFERHYRDLEDPWSFRQSALHHSFLTGSKQSIWVVIQPPKVFDLTLDSTSHPMSLHLRYLQAAIANWREYLDSFSQESKLLRLHHLKGKLHHAQNILTNTRETLNIIATHESSVAQQQSLDPPFTTSFSNLRVCDDLKGMYSELHKFRGRELQRAATSKGKFLATDDAAGSKDMTTPAKPVFKDAQ
ncbi:hypothetical protein GGR58DRAFT_504437 [Xylaria digitata]|nr:hypothetical protein GGR58DRAFT_504437 [Xylaria digitata]